MYWSEWWGKATDLWVDVLRRKRVMPLSLLWMEGGRRYYEMGKTPRQYVEYYSKRLYPRKRRGFRKVMKLIGR